jgi:nucleotide-binding universal stress UspA family protein
VPPDRVGLEGAPVARIVVGVDASPDSKAALAWAAAEAHMRQAVLQVVYAFHARELAAPEYVPTQHGMPGSAAVYSLEGPEAGAVAQPDSSATLRDRTTFEEVARTTAAELLGSALYEQRDALAGVEVQRVVIDDKHPAEALVEVSSDADLLVVGSRGRGGFKAMLLGSVSHAVVLHAACPVVVVPSGRDG